MPSKRNRKKELSSRQRRDLDIEIGFVEGVVRRDPGYVEALQVLAENYTLRGRYTESLGADVQLSRLLPDDALVRYNLACSYSLAGRIEDAVRAIHKALDLGYRDFRWISRDPDLAPIRKHPHYKELRSRIRTLKLEAH